MIDINVKDYIVIFINMRYIEIMYSGGQHETKRADDDRAQAD